VYLRRSKVVDNLEGEWSKHPDNVDGAINDNYGNDPQGLQGSIQFTETRQMLHAWGDRLAAGK
jgi:hypothetical protein